MSGKIYLYILVCAAVSFLIRELPLTLIRKPIKSRFLRSFLFYVPYVTLWYWVSPPHGSAQICSRLPSAAALSCWYWNFSCYNRRTPRPDGRGVRVASIKAS